MLKFGYGIVLDDRPDILNFIFFSGLDAPSPGLVSITPPCPYYVCSNSIMMIFSVDGHHLAFLYDRT